MPLRLSNPRSGKAKKRGQIVPNTKTKNSRERTSFVTAIARVRVVVAEAF